MRPGSSGASGSRTSARRSPSWRAPPNWPRRRGHHPDIGFGWGYATVSLRTKKIKGLHENDFIMAAKLDRLASGGAAETASRQEG
jgi:hypothetical protein